MARTGCPRRGRPEQEVDRRSGRWSAASPARRGRPHRHGKTPSEDVTPSERFARHERVLPSKASPQLVGSRRWYLAARGDDGAVALEHRDSRELIGAVVSHVVEEDSERLGVLRTGESSRPLDIADSLLGHTSCVLKNEIVRDVPVVADRLDEECDRQNGSGGQECLEPQRRTRHRHKRGPTVECTLQRATPGVK